MAPSEIERPYDLLVIGGGSGGYAAARTGHELGMRVAVVDGAEKLGGLCILRGCMPSKTLIESANRYRAIRQAEEFGLRAENTSVIPAEIVARKERLIGEFADYRSEQLQDERFGLLRGRAKFVNPHSVEIEMRDGEGIRTVGFRSAVVATGSSIARLPIEGLEETGYWTSDDILDADSLPGSITVLGGGAIALEMASYLEGLGVKVSVIQRSPQLLRGTDLDVAQALEKSLDGRANMTIFTGTSLERVELNHENGKKTVHFQHEGESKSVVSDQILQALGRRPNSQGLEAATAGIRLDEGSGRIQTTSDQRAGAEHIFAAGDVCGPHEVVHIAIEQGEIAAHNAAAMLGFTSADERHINYRLKLYGIFTDPQVATVGLSENEASDAGRNFRAATYPFDDHGKSMVMGETHGFVKMIADSETGEILGASVIGPEAVDLIHEVVVAMHFKATTNEFIKIPHYHPTLSEIWTYPAEDLLISP
ncbi:MAG: NAD(P)/FAD-dependent oxidoreductase [Verrucomicrobiota bacterium]